MYIDVLCYTSSRLRDKATYKLVKGVSSPDGDSHATLAVQL